MQKALTTACLAVAFLATAVSAHAQYRPRPLDDPSTGESFHIEADATWWPTSADITVQAAGGGALTGLLGTNIDAKRDLGFTDQRFPMLNLQLRPARRHHFRLQYIPISYTGNFTLQRDLVFNGIRFPANIPVNSSLDWKAYRFGYQYDFIVRNRGFGGFIMEAKYTNVQVQLNSPVATELDRVRAPIPAIGGIARVYVVPNISITGEVTGFTLPDSIDSRYKAHYVDVDVYGTINFTDQVGVKAGYRSLDFGYAIKDDTGAFVLKGIYFGAVIRY